MDLSIALGSFCISQGIALTLIHTVAMDKLIEAVPDGTMHTYVHSANHKVVATWPIMATFHPAALSLVKNVLRMSHS